MITTHEKGTRGLFTYGKVWKIGVLVGVYSGNPSFCEYSPEGINTSLIKKQSVTTDVNQTAGKRLALNCKR